VFTYFVAYNLRETSVTSVEMNAQQDNDVLVLPAIMMLSSAVGNILIISQPHMRDTIKGISMTLSYP